MLSYGLERMTKTLYESFKIIEDIITCIFVTLISLANLQLLDTIRKSPIFYSYDTIIVQLTEILNVKYYIII